MVVPKEQEKYFLSSVVITRNIVQKEQEKVVKKEQPANRVHPPS